MYWTQKPYRDFYDQLLAHAGRDVVGEVVNPWLDSADAKNARTWLAPFARRPGAPIPLADDEELCILYALSRVNQVLLLPFQPHAVGGDAWPGPPIDAMTYLD